jgi:hypothetical protein
VDHHKHSALSAFEEKEKEDKKIEGGELSGSTLRHSPPEAPLSASETEEGEL